MMNNGAGPAQRESIESASAAGSPALADQQSKDLKRMLLMTLGGETFAIEIECVRELAAFDHLTPIPTVPRFFAGLTVVRGELIAVLDLALLWGEQPTDLRSVSRLVVLGGGHAELALLAEKAEELCNLDRQHLESVPARFENAGFVVGATGDGLIVLNGHALLEDQRIYA
jgi:purine-binding chemotaxis protein CheW